MVIIKSTSAKTILDSRGEKTISVSIKTNTGSFSSSAPNGKSTGKHATKIYKKDIETDIETIKKFKDYFSEEVIECFGDLRRVEDIIKEHVGANTLFALESAVLKALAKKEHKEIWEIINPYAKKLPRLVGNCIGGGKHTNQLTKPDFQEFLLIPESKSVREAYEKNKKIKEELKYSIKKKDIKFKSEKNDENAWITKLNDKEVLEILKKTKMPLGVDVAASGFFRRKIYHYKNPPIKRNSEDQFNYLHNLIKNFNLFYIEDPFDEDDFENFAKLLSKTKRKLIVGDDLIVTNTKRLKKAIEKQSINGVIVKPNQNGSLLEVKEVCALAKKNNIKTIFSHRSGETNENILADLAFGFEADFFKSGIDGKEREAKLKRLIEIEKDLKR